MEEEKRHSDGDIYSEAPSHAMSSSASPPWGSTTKLVVALSLVALLAGLVISFRNIVGPLLLSFVLSYLLYPAADKLRKLFRISWQLSVNLIYLVAVILIISLLFWGTIILVEQIQSLITFLEGWIGTIPAWLEQVALTHYRFGPFELNFAELDIDGLVAELLNTIRPMFSQVGVIVGTAAQRIAITLGWVLFILLISFFILSETHGVPERFINIRIARYQHDIQRLGTELARIWNAFLRGQLTIILLTLIIYSIFLGIFGVRYFYGLAMLAGLARFIPYVGPAIAWSAFGLVTYFQGFNPFGLTPLAYAAIVVGVSLLLDSLMDNFVVPRLMGNALKIHPAAVMVAALVGASLLGVIGIILAAPVLATARLFTGYALHKLSDEDPWPDEKPEPADISLIERWRLLFSNAIIKFNQRRAGRKVNLQNRK